MLWIFPSCCRERLVTLIRDVVVRVMEEVRDRALAANGGRQRVRRSLPHLEQVVGHDVDVVAAVPHPPGKARKEHDLRTLPRTRLVRRCRHDGVYGKGQQDGRPLGLPRLDVGLLLRGVEVRARLRHDLDPEPVELITHTGRDRGRKVSGLVPYERSRVVAGAHLRDLSRAQLEHARRVAGSRWGRASCRAASKT
jgi:hypothetical protein